MQLKLLNFHKILSQFSSNIVGAFIALIVYQSTGNFSYAFLYLVLDRFIRIFFSAVFFKKMQQHPQLFLLIKIVPFLFYLLAILLLDTHLRVLGIIITAIFHGMSLSFQELPMELTYSYSALNKGATSNGFSKLLENIGILVAIILGGLFLDNLPKWVPIVISCVVYLISIIPLFLYYLLHKKEGTFNKDATSNALESFKDIKIKEHQQQVICKKLLLSYFFIYFCFCAYDGLMNLFSLYLFKVNAECYSFTAYIQAGFYALFGLGCYIAGKLDDKIDITKICCVCCVLSGAIVCGVPFASNIIILEVVLFSIIGFLYSFISIFCYSRMMTRCKIMGISNTALNNRVQASRLVQIVIYSIGAISPVMFIPAFVVTGVLFASCSISIPVNEERTRKILVDYLENNKLY